MIYLLSKAFIAATVALIAVFASMQLIVLIYDADDPASFARATSVLFVMFLLTAIAALSLTPQG